MAYNDTKVEAGKERIDVVVLHFEGCALDFGATNGFGTCPATGEPCYQGWATCKAQESYVPTDFPVTLVTPHPELPPELGNAIPFLKPNGINMRATEPEAEEGLGRRGSITISAINAPHDDVGIDPYVTSRAYNPLDRGTFWPRMRVRFPYYQTRLLEWYTGYFHDSFSLANLQKRSYVMENLEGWGGKSDIRIVAKDVLKLADDDRAKCPVKSTGTLDVAIADTGTPTEIDILTDDVDEYDILSYEPMGVIRIGKECFQYTTIDKVVLAGGVRLTGITRAAPHQYETETSAHDQGAEVQKCVYFYQEKPHDVYRYLLRDFADVDDATYIPYADWALENDTWIAGLTLTRLITSPEGVKSHINEIIPQASTWGLWVDAELGTIQYRVVRPPDVDETVLPVTDTSEMVEESVYTEDESDQLINEVNYLFDQIDPTKKKDELTNYRAGVRNVSLDSQGAREHNRKAIKTVYGRWSPSANRAELVNISDRLMATRANIPVLLEFELERKDDHIKFGDFIDVTSEALLDASGLLRPEVRFRIVKATFKGKVINLQAREDYFSLYFARWALDSIPNGQEYNASTEDEQDRYMFWADTDDLFHNTYPGRAWL